MKCYITLTRAYILICVYSSALDFTLNTFNTLSLHHTKVVQKMAIEKKAHYIKHLTFI